MIANNAMKIDFSEIRNVLTHVHQLIDAHQGEDIYKAQIGAARRHDAKTAALLNDLLAMQDCLRMADAEISAIYWQSEGRDDPRRPAPSPHRAVNLSRSADTNLRGGTSPGHSVGRIQRIPAQPRETVSR